jgi:putative transposase
MSHSKQTKFFKTNWRHETQAGGVLRNKRAGRGRRPLSTRRPLHVVFKLNRQAHQRGLRHPATYTLVRSAIQQYARRFFVKIEHVSIQGDHIHLLIRTSKRSLFHYFFRVLAGQIAQRVTGTSSTPRKGPKFWKYRPFSRVIEGWKAFLRARDYIQLNEKEARGEIPYRKERLKGLSEREIEELWE